MFNVQGNKIFASWINSGHLVYLSSMLNA